MAPSLCGRSSARVSLSAPMAWAVLLLAGACYASPEADDASPIAMLLCNNTGSRSSRGPHCRHSIELTPTAPQLVCVENAELSLGTLLLTGGLLRAFDVETAHIRAERLSLLVDFQATSEDTWLTGLVSASSAAGQGRALFSPESASALQQQLASLRRALSAVWHGDANSRSVAFSPFYPSCIGLKATGSTSVNVTIQWFREGPDASARPGSPRDAFAGSQVRLWAGPALFVLGWLLFAYAPVCAESVLFHYASGVALSMALGVLVIAFFVWHRTGRRRPGIFLAALLSSLGVTATAVKDWAKGAVLELAVSHWPYVLAYLSFFAVIGYALTFYRLRGGRPEQYECALLSRAMRLIALALIASSSHSLRVSFSLLCGIVMLYGMPRGPVRAFVRVVRRASERGPAAPPAIYVTEAGQHATWRPATRSGKYLSAAQYEAQKKKATDAELQKHFSSPEYQKWLMNNHGRMKIDEVGEETRGRRLNYSDDED